MTIFELQDAFVEFVTQNTSDYLLRSNEETAELIPPHVWGGFIPRNEVGAVLPLEVTIYPAIIVQAKQGIQTAEDFDLVEVDVLIGAFDDNKDQQGFNDVINLIQRLKDRVNEQSIIRERFPRRLPIKWVVNRYVGGTSTNYYPYFFGELSFMFELPVMASQYDVGYMDGETTPGRLNIPANQPEPKLAQDRINRFINGED
jgi:hypothetical protein